MLRKKQVEHNSDTKQLSIGTRRDSGTYAVTEGVCTLYIDMSRRAEIVSPANDGSRAFQINGSTIM